MSGQTNKSIISDLWKRRVPQFAATYVGICWGILQFLLFATNRYQLNGDLVDKFLIFAVILLPGVFVFIYNHGTPGKDTWKKYEKILIPANFLIALVFAGLFQSGNEMNAAPVEVQVTDEFGDTITRFVPAASETKSFGVFPLLNAKDDEQSDWLKFAIPELLKRDLEQDMRMYCLSPYSFDYSFKSNNAELTDNDVSFSKYLKIAKDRIINYFIIGDYSKVGDNVSGSLKVYETNSGELFFEKSFDNQNIYSVVDEFSRDLSKNLFLSDGSLKIPVTDLPCADLITSNLKALELYTEARNQISINENTALAAETIDKAAIEDPNSSMIKSSQAAYYYSTGKVDAALDFTNQALDLSETLPERQKFSIRQQFYIYQQQMDKNLALLETWKKLYPRDYYPYNQLIEYYSLTQNINKAKQIGQEAIENGHGSRVLKRLAGYEITQGNLIKAEDYINQYYEIYPHKNKMEDTQLADIYLKKGEFDKAEKWYESIQILNPNDHDLKIKLSDVYVRKGEFRKAEQSLLDALSTVKLKEDSLTIYNSLILFYYRSGQVDKFMETANKHFVAASPNEPRIGSAFQHMQFGAVYTIMGQEARIWEIGEMVNQHAPQLSQTYDCVANFLYSMIKENKTEFEKTYTGYCKEIITRGTPTIQYLADGFLAKMSGNYAEAIRMFETYVDTTGQDQDMYGGWIAQCYRLDNRIDRAQEFCETALKTHPSEGTILLEYARILNQKGNTKKAKQIIEDIKNKIWYNSDERFQYYKDLLEFEKEINS